MASAGVQVYADLLSQPCRAVLIFIKVNNIPHTVSPVALRKGEQKSAEFTLINPMQKVPVIDHSGFILTESDAVLKYLCSVFNVPDHWYPREPQRRARVDEYTAWHHTHTRTHTASVFIIEVLQVRVTGKPVDQVKLIRALETLDETLQMMEKMFLRQQLFLCGDDVTIADLLAICEIMQPLAGGRDVLKNHQNLQRWRTRVQSALGEPFTQVHSVLFKLRDKNISKL